MSLCSICLPDENRDVTALHLQFCLFIYLARSITATRVIRPTVLAFITAAVALACPSPAGSYWLDAPHDANRNTRIQLAHWHPPLAPAPTLGSPDAVNCGDGPPATALAGGKNTG